MKWVPTPPEEMEFYDGFYAPPPDGETLVVYTIFEKPKDFPDEFVARRFEVRSGAVQATRFYARSKSLEAARATIPEDKVCIVVEEGDLCIVESWI